MKVKELIGRKSPLLEIKQNCKQFLNETSKPLLRGFDHISAYEFPHPSKRKQLNSSNAWQKIFNYSIEKIFGIENIRSTTLFATGQPQQARIYGNNNVNFVFLKDGYKCLNSARIEDSWNDLDFFRDFDLEVEKILKISNDIYPYFEALALQEIFDSALENVDINSDDLAKEVIKHFDNYCDCPTCNCPTPTANKFKNNIDLIIKAFRKHILTVMKEENYKKVNIDKAISNKTEILIYEGTGYYLVDAYRLNDWMSDIIPKSQEAKIALDKIKVILKDSEKFSPTMMSNTLIYDSLRILIDEA